MLPGKLCLGSQGEKSSEITQRGEKKGQDRSSSFIKFIFYCAQMNISLVTFWENELSAFL